MKAALLSNAYTMILQYIPIQKMFSVSAGERRRSSVSLSTDGQVNKKGVKDKKGQGSKSSQVSYVNECSGTDKDAVREYIRKRDRYKQRGGLVDNDRSSTSLSEPASASLRPISVHSTRSLPTPVMTKSLEEVCMKYSHHL